MGTLKAIARRDRKRGAMHELPSAGISEAGGVAGDFRGKPGKRQVTVLSAEVWNSVCSELGADLPWTTRRANLLVEGIELPRAAGAVIEIGVPAEHITEIEHEMTLPTPHLRPDREWDGQRFVHHQAKGAVDPVNGIF